MHVVAGPWLNYFYERPFVFFISPLEPRLGQTGLAPFAAGLSCQIILSLWLFLCWGLGGLLSSFHLQMSCPQISAWWSSRLLLLVFVTRTFPASYSLYHSIFSLSSLFLASWGFSQTSFLEEQCILKI